MQLPELPPWALSCGCSSSHPCGAGCAHEQAVWSFPSLGRQSQSSFLLKTQNKNALHIITATVILLFKKKSIFIFWWQIWKSENYFLSQGEVVAFQNGGSVKTQLSPLGSFQAFLPRLRTKHTGLLPQPRAAVGGPCCRHSSKPAVYSSCSRLTLWNDERL